MATEVGTAYVAIIPSAKGFAKTLQKAIAEEFSGSKIDKMISDAFAGRKVTIPVKPELDESSLSTDSISRQKVKLPVSIDRGEAAAEGVSASRAAERAAPKVKLKVDIDQAGLSARAANTFAAVASQVSADARQVMGVASNATSSLVGLATAFTVVAGAAAVAGPAIYLLGAALGSLPALAAGGGAALGALGLGFMGIADAFKETAKGAGSAGQSAAASARQIAAAERGIVSAGRGVVRALREERDAQEAVNRARKTALERIQDLAREQSGAQLDEEEAVLRVKDAQKDLDDARKHGNTDEIEHAALAYRQAQQALEDARDTTQDLTEETQAASRAGVEGSDEVQAALQRQRDATEAVASATDSLTAAHEQLAAAQEKTAAGGAAALADVIKLAPAAQRFVDAVKGLKPAFEGLRLDVQQRLFAGLDGTVKSLASRWMPQLTKTLGDYASTFNGLAKRFAQSIGQKSFIDNVAAGAESARKALARIGMAVSGPLVDAFGRLSRAAGPFVEALGDEVAKLVEDFSHWIEQADKSGKLNTFFDKASGFLRDVFDMGRDVASIFGSIAEILFGGDGKAATTPWDGLKNKLDDLAKWFDDPKNQEKVRGWIQKIEGFIDNFINRDAPKIQEMLDKVGGWITTVDMWAQRIGQAKDLIVGAFDEMAEKVTGSARGIAGAIESLGAPVSNAIGFFGRLRTGAAAQMDALVALAWSLPGKISAAVGGLGTLLYTAGRNLITGLINGIYSRVPSLGGALGYVTNFIRDNKGPIEKDRRLLTPAGQAIMQGLIGGLHGERTALAAELAGITADITVGGTATAGVAGYRAPAAPAPAGIELSFVGAAPDSFFSWMRQNVKASYDGSAQKAIGTGKR